MKRKAQIKRRKQMSCLAENLRDLLWKNKGELSQKTYREYIVFVAKQCGIEPNHFRGILCDEETATEKEVASLREFFNDYSDNLEGIQYAYQYTDLIDKAENEILVKNLQYLFGTIKHGENATFVSSIEVNPSTLTRWKQGKSKPDKYAQEQIAEYFGLKDAEDLRSELLFLDLDPVSTQQKKQECKRLIDEMSKDDFERIFAGLKKLLK